MVCEEQTASGNMILQWQPLSYWMIAEKPIWIAKKSGSCPTRPNASQRPIRYSPLTCRETPWNHADIHGLSSSIRFSRLNRDRFSSGFMQIAVCCIPSIVPVLVETWVPPKLGTNPVAKIRYDPKGNYFERLVPHFEGATNFGQSI